MRKSHLGILSLAIAMSASQAALAVESDVPTSDELAPIVIPSSSIKTTQLAYYLDQYCTKLAGVNKAPATGTFDSTKPPDKVAVMELAAICNNVASGNPLTLADVQNLRALKSIPNYQAYWQQVESILHLVTNDVAPAGSVTTTSSSGDIFSNVINGLATFIYDRAKATATLYLAKELKDKLCGEKEAPFFPNLCVAFNQLDVNLSLTAIGAYMAAAARKDLVHMPDTALVYGIHAVKGAPASTGKDNALGLLFGSRVGYAYYREVASGRTALDVARGLHGTKPKDIPSQKTFDFLQLSSELVDAVAGQDKWSNSDSLATRTAQQWRCYAIGVFLSLEDIRSADTGSQGDPFGLATAPNKLAAVNAVIKDLPAIIQDITDVNGRLEAVRKGMANQNTPANNGSFAGGQGTTTTAATYTVRDYVISVSRMLQRVASDGAILAKDLELDTSTVTQTLDVLQDTGELGQLVVSGQSIGDMTLSALSLLNHISAQLKDFAVPQSRAVQDIEKLLPFLTELAQSKSAEEASNVIAAAAAPISTYELKSKRGFVAVNALAGVTGGAEYVDIGKASWSGFIAPFAPVGINATTPVRCGHIGAFVSVLNLGALVAARFNDDTGPVSADGTKQEVGSTTKVDFINVLSPGAFFTYGIVSSPFMIGAGVQVVPARHITKIASDGSTSESSAAAVQALGFAAVDVPLFEL